MLLRLKAGREKSEVHLLGPVSWMVYSTLLLLAKNFVTDGLACANLSGRENNRAKRSDTVSFFAVHYEA